MDNLNNPEKQTCTASPTRVPGRRLKLPSLAVVLLLVGTAFVVTGCYDPYYGRGRVHTGVYANYGTPGPYYYGGTPYGYGYGSRYVGVPRYRTSSAIVVGTAGHRGYYATRPRHRSRVGYRTTSYRRSGSQVRRSRSEVRRGRGSAQRRQRDTDAGEDDAR